MRGARRGGAADALEDEAGQSIARHRGDGKRPHACIPERSAFYRILLRHQDRVGVRKVQVLCAIAVMIGKGVGLEGEGLVDAPEAQKAKATDERTSKKPAGR